MKDYTVMNDELFYCRPWDDKNHKTDVNGYTIIVSDLIYGNEEHSVVQIHIAVIRDNKIVRKLDVSDNWNDNKKAHWVQYLQKNLRDSMSCHLKWKEGVLDRDIIKIWFYRPEDDPTSSRSDLYLRMAVTAINVESVDKSTEKVIQNDVVYCIQQFVWQNL